MNKYFIRLLQKFQPHGEPMRYILKVKGNMKYLYALMNNEPEYAIHCIFGITVTIFTKRLHLSSKFVPGKEI
jgi:hypothetical protein